MTVCHTGCKRPFHSQECNSQAIFVKQEKPNKTLHSSHTQTQAHTHTYTHSSFPSKQKSILSNQIMQALFKCLKRMRIGLSASQFFFLITMKSQVSKVLGHKEVSVDLQDILTHAEVLCWLRPRLGTAPRPAGTHDRDSTTCTNIHEVRAKLKRAEQCKRRKRLCGSSELCLTASAAYTRHVTVISID